MSTTELLLREEEARLNVFPIRHPAVWKRYKEAFKAFWTPGEIDLSKDRDDFERLAPKEQQFLLHVLAFFAAADGVVNDNLAERFCDEVKVREVKMFYDFQRMMENVHNEVYGLLIETLVSDEAERLRLQTAAVHIPVVARKVQWAQRWMNDQVASFATRLIAFGHQAGLDALAGCAQILHVASCRGFAARMADLGAGDAAQEESGGARDQGRLERHRIE